LRRHETLRTVFPTVDGSAIQRITSDSQLELPLIDLAALPPAAASNERNRLLRETAHQYFDLARGPLLRVRLIRSGAERHVVSLAAHHIVADGWSLGIVLRELAELYTARVTGAQAFLDELPIQYADFAAWEREWLSGEALETHLAYWKQQLADLSPLRLPTDRPRPRSPQFAGDRVDLLWPRPLCQQIEKLGRDESCTVFMVILAAFQVLLRAYTGQDDIVIGTDTAGRSRRETEGLVGFFVNELAIRTRLAAGMTFRELLQSVRTTVLDAFAHQALPFERLVAALNPDRDRGRMPLFQVTLLMQNTPAPNAKFARLELEPLADTGPLVARYDMTLLFQETPRGLEGSFIYSTALFDAATIERMAVHLRTIVESAVSRPDRSLRSISLLSAGQRRQLRDWGRHEAHYASEATIDQLIGRSVASHPDRVAIVGQNQVLTYAELNARANQLAHLLRSWGVRAEACVGVCCARSLNQIVAILGVLKSGGAYLPLDPTYPIDRLAFTIGDAQPLLVLTDEQTVDSIPTGLTTHLLVLDREREVLSRLPRTDPKPLSHSDNLAYVIYTSGSTGRPKGTLLVHRGLCNLAAAHRGAYCIAPGARLLQFASCGYDASIAETLNPLASGDTLVLTGPRGLLPGTELVFVVFMRRR